MERTESFSALPISTLRIRLTCAALTVTVDEVTDLQVTISGDRPECIRLRRRDGVLSIHQPFQPGRRVTEVIVSVPMDWKGALDAATLSGPISTMGLYGTDFTLRSLTGGIFVESVQGITADLRSLSGPIAASDLICDCLNLRSLYGQAVLSACSFLTCSHLAAHSRTDMDLLSPFDSLSIRCLTGGATVYAPLDAACASLSSVRGRLLTDGIAAAPDAPRIRMLSVTAGLQLICSLDNQAMI
jgi:hypothetical protein